MTYAVRYSKIVIIEKVLEVSDVSNVTYFGDFDSACAFALSLMETRINQCRQRHIALIELLRSLETNNAIVS